MDLELRTSLWYYSNSIRHGDQKGYGGLGNDDSMPLISPDDEDFEEMTAFEVDAFSNQWVAESLLQLNEQQRESNRKLKESSTMSQLESHLFNEDKVAANANRHWHSFYLRNTTNFYKDRHYLTKVYPELRIALEALSTEPVQFLEVGCGVGNAMMPLAAQYKDRIRVSGVDFAESAIQLLKSHPDYGALGCNGYVNDISCEPLPKEIPAVDFTLMLFVLSAIHPSKMETAVRNSISKLKPGGMFLFRDYAMLDQAQLRFDPEQRLGYNLYARQDGTQSYFFTLEGISWLFERTLGLKCIDSRYIHRIVKNNKQGKVMRRVWVNCCYQKPFD